MNVLCTYLWPETTYFSFALDSAVIGASKAAKKEPNFFVRVKVRERGRRRQRERERVSGELREHFQYL